MADPSCLIADNPYNMLTADYGALYVAEPGTLDYGSINAINISGAHFHKIDCTYDATSSSGNQFNKLLRASSGLLKLRSLEVTQYIKYDDTPMFSFGPITGGTYRITSNQALRVNGPHAVELYDHDDTNYYGIIMENNYFYRSLV